MNRSSSLPLIVAVAAALLAIGPAPPAGAQPRDAAPQPAAEAAPRDPLVAEGEELLRKLVESGDARRKLDAEALAATGERRLLLEEQLWQQQLEVQANLQALGVNLTRQREAGGEIAEARASLQERVKLGWPGFRKQLLKREARRDELADDRDVAKGEERLALEKQIDGATERILGAYEALVDWVTVLEPLGIDVTKPRDFAEKRLADAAETRAAGVRVVLRQRDELATSAARAPEDADVKRQLQAAEVRVERVTAELSSVASLLDRLGLETASYRQLLFASTGKLTTDVLDRKVALGLLQQWRTQLGKGLAANGPRWFFQALVFLLIVAAFRGLASVTRRVVERSVASSRVTLSQLLQHTLVAWSGRAVMLLGLLIALSQLGFRIGPLLAGLGIAGFVLGFALQDSLANFAAGAMILAYRPYDVGDVIEAAGVTGKVSKMSLVATTFLTFDNQTLIVPNGKIWGDVIRNVTAQTIRRVDLVFGIGYQDDVDHADAVLHEILSKHDKVLDQPEPVVEVHALGESSVDFIVRPWVRTEDYWAVHWGLTRQVKKRFDEEGISIPFPQRDVHLHVNKGTEGA